MTLNVQSNKVSSRSSAVGEAEIVYAAFSGGKLSPEFLSHFPLAQILLDLHRTGIQSDFIEINRGEVSLLDGERGIKSDDFFYSQSDYLSATSDAVPCQKYVEGGISRSKRSFRPFNYWNKVVDPSSLTIDSEDTRIPTDSHAEDLIKIAPHMRYISHNSLDMDGVLTAAGGVKLCSVLPSPFFQNCLNPADSSSGAESWSAGKSSEKRQKVPSDAVVASILSQRLNQQIAAELASYVAALAHEMPLEEFASVENTLFTKIFSLVNSKDSTVSDRMSGIFAMDHLLDVSSSDEEKKAIKFANNLSNSLRASGDYDFLAAATRALGRMAMGSANADFVEFEVSRALEWLKSERPDRRLAATLALKALARNAPTTFYSKTNQSAHGAGSNEFIENIFPVIRDSQPIVRACAVDALSECLQFLIKRHHRSITGYLCQMYSIMMDGLSGSTRKTFSPTSSDDFELHGSILVLQEMISHTGYFMLPRFEEVCDVIFTLTSHPKALIRLQVVRLCPRLARACPSVFKRKVLATALDFFIHTAATVPSARNSVIDLRPSSYLALGQLSLVMTDMDEDLPAGAITTTAFSDSYYQRLDSIFSLVQAGLARTPSSIKSATDMNITRAALNCGANIVKALGEHAFPYVEDLLSGMYKSGLSDDLIDSLRSVATSIPAKQRVIEHRLLEELSICLAGTSFLVGYDPPLLQYDEIRSHRQRPKSQDTETPIGLFLFPEVSLQTDKAHIKINMSNDPSAVSKLVLSLRTLGSFTDNRKLAGPGVYEALLPFVKDVVTKYLAHPTVEVRQEAALCCCHLLLPAILADATPEIQKDKSIESPFSSYLTADGVKQWFSASRVGSAAAPVVEEVLKTLTTFVVSDPSPAMRLCVVQSLDARYDPYLCMSHHLLPLFLLLRDEKLYVRAAALQLLGRLCLHNPAPILPPLRRLLLELLTELRTGSEAAVRLLIVFLNSEALHRLVHPYISTIILSLPLRGVAPRLASVSLEALGTLAEVEQCNMFPYVGHLFPSLLDTMQDYSSATKQTTSFKTLGQIAGSTGYVITPYLHYPQLLPLASAVLPGTKRAPWSLRREVIRTLGILGAVDPQKYTSVFSKSRKRGGWGGGYFAEDEDDSFKVDTGTEQKTNKPLKPTEKGAATFNSSEHFAVEIKENDDDEPAHFCMYEQYSCMAQPISKLPPPKRLSPLNEDFYSTVAIQALTRILKDPSLAVHHGMAMQAIMFTFNALGLKCVKYLPRVLPHLLQTVRTCNQSALREALLQQIAKLSNIVKDHLRPYVDSIFCVVEEFWASRHLPTILLLVEHMAEAVPECFTYYVSRLVPLLLASLDAPRVSEWSSTSSQNINSSESAVADSKRLELVLRSIRSLKGILTEYLHLLIPSLVKLVDTISNSNNSLVAENGNYGGEGDIVRANIAVLTLETLSTVIAGDSCLQGKSASFSNAAAYASQADASQQIPARAAQPLIRILGRKPHPSRCVGTAIVETLCVCAIRLGREQWVFYYHSPARNAILLWQEWVSPSASTSPTSIFDERWKLSGGVAVYDNLTKSLLEKNVNVDSIVLIGKSGRLQEADRQYDLLKRPDDSLITDDEGRNVDSESGIFGNAHGSLPPIQPVNQASTFRVNQVHLQRAWDVSQRTTREDWDEWIRRFSVQLLRESPNAALRAAAGLAHAFPSLGRELFCAAFLCCWVELSEQYQKNLVQSLEVVYVSSDVSPEILQALLNLCEVGFIAPFALPLLQS